MYFYKKCYFLKNEVFEKYKKILIFFNFKLRLEMISQQFIVTQKYYKYLCFYLTKLNISQNVIIGRIKNILKSGTFLFFIYHIYLWNKYNINIC